MAERTFAATPAPDGPGRRGRRAQADDEIVVVAEVWTRAIRSLKVVDLAAGLIVLAQLGAVLALVVPGSFYASDLQAQGSAFGRSLHDYLVVDRLLGDQSAIPRLLTWLLAHGMPLEHSPAVLITLGIRLALGLVAWALFRQLFGPRALALVPLALLLLSPVLVPATAWFSLAISGLLATTALLWAIDAQLRWVRRPAWYHLPQIMLASSLAVLSHPKGLAVPVLLAVVSLAVHVSGSRPGFGPPAGGWLLTLRRSSAGLIASALGLVAALSWYDPIPTGPDGPGLASTFDDGLGAVVRSVLPALFGGPWSWSHPSPYYGVAATSTAVVAMSCLVAGAGVARWAVLRPSETSRATVLLVGWLVPAMVLVARQGHGVVPTPDLAQDLGLWTDAAAALVLAGAMAAIPWRIGACQADRPVFDQQAGEWLLVTSLGDDPIGQVGPRRPTGLPVLVSLLVGLVGSVLAIGSWSSFSRQWWDNPTGAWLATVTASVRQAEVYPRIGPQPIPLAVLPLPWQGGLPVDAPLVGLLRPDTRFVDGDGPVRVLDAAGVLRPATPLVIAQATGTGCVARLERAGQRVVVALPRPVPPTFGSLLEVGVLVKQATRIRIFAQTPQGGGLLPSRWSDDLLPAGAHTLRVPVPPGATVGSLVVQSSTSPQTCVTAARIVRFTT